MYCKSTTVIHQPTVLAEGPVLNGLKHRGRWGCRSTPRDRGLAKHRAGTTVPTVVQAVSVQGTTVVLAVAAAGPVSVQGTTVVLAVAAAGPVDPTGQGRGEAQGQHRCRYRAGAGAGLVLVHGRRLTTTTMGWWWW